MSERDQFKPFMFVQNLYAAFHHFRGGKICGFGANCGKTFTCLYIYIYIYADPLS